MGTLIKLIGQRFSRLLVLELCTQRTSGGKAKWLCICDCGTKKEIASTSLVSGDTHSCGCMLKETTIARNITHGLSHTIEYRIWQGMRNRCYNENNARYYSYGERGITICDRWLNSFENFYADMGHIPSLNHSIDRVDNNGDYEPGNCRWATWEEQANNRRNNVLYNYRGLDYTLAQLSEEFYIKPKTIQMRLIRGSTVEEAIETPIRS